MGEYFYFSLQCNLNKMLERLLEFVLLTEMLSVIIICDIK